MRFAKETPITNLDTFDAVSPVIQKFEKDAELYQIEGGGIDIFLRRNFLTDQECDILIDLIEDTNHPSRLMGGPPDPEFRSSSSSPLCHSKHPLVTEVEKRISEFSDLDPSFQESIEGQRYLVGQQFKPHFDAFLPDHDYFPIEIAIGGQRTWTFMLALNTPDEGGGTMFPNAGVRISPRKGNLIAWCNVDRAGRINPNSLHCGEPVLAGRKYVATKWYRQRAFQPWRRKAVLKQQRQKRDER